MKNCIYHRLDTQALISPPKRGNSTGYSREWSTQAINHRYEGVYPTVRYTLKRLLDEPRIRDVIANLKEAGWLDWHILTSIGTIVVNYRARQEAGDDPQLFNEACLRYHRQPESETSSPIPLEEFTEENLRFHLRIMMPSTLRLLGLEIHQSTPDLAAIEDFLAHRYNFWTDDVDHADLGF